ncbi:MAG TPA: HAD family phosphatase [Acidimicrobiales bacterium]|nr:HAD family phosphatase [Acidimicrobiales bacterium]
MAISAVLFDLTGVLTTSPWPNLTAAAGGNVELLVGAYHEDGDHPWHRLERGEIGFAEWFQEVSALAQAAGVELDLTPMAALREEMVVFPHVVERVLELRRDGYKTALITNNVREGSNLWRSLIPVDELFDVVVDSSAEGVRKPNPAIFELALAKLGVADPGDAVFLDDLESNVDAARAVGLRAILVGDPPDAALDELDALLAAN